MSRSLDFLYDDCAGRKLFGRNRQLAGPSTYAMPLCRSVLVLSPIGSISLSYNAIKWNIIDKMLRLFQTPPRQPTWKRHASQRIGVPDGTAGRLLVSARLFAARAEAPAPHGLTTGAFTVFRLLGEWAWGSFRPSVGRCARGECFAR